MKYRKCILDALIVFVEWWSFYLKTWVIKSQGFLFYSPVIYPILNNDSIELYFGYRTKWHGKANMEQEDNALNTREYWVHVVDQMLSNHRQAGGIKMESTEEDFWESRRDTTGRNNLPFHNHCKFLFRSLCGKVPSCKVLDTNLLEWSLRIS